MVSADSVADVWLLLVLLGNLGTIECVRQFALLIGHLTYIVQQAGTLCLLRVQAQLGCHNGTEVGCLASVLQEVLTVRRAILHLTDDADKLWVQAVDTEVDGCALTGLDNLVVELLLNLCHNLLDACRVDTSVGYELVQGKAANLTTYWVEG